MDKFRGSKRPNGLQALGPVQAPPSAHGRLGRLLDWRGFEELNRLNLMIRPLSALCHPRGPCSGTQSHCIPKPHRPLAIANAVRTAGTATAHPRKRLSWTGRAGVDCLTSRYVGRYIEPRQKKRTRKPVRLDWTMIQPGAHWQIQRTVGCDDTF